MTDATAGLEPFDPHTTFIDGEPLSEEEKRQFRRFVTRSILKRGCIYHDRECPLMEPLPIIRSKNE